MADISDNRKVFISYAREDIEKALRLYHDLKGAGMIPWMDEENLLPGHKWQSIIERKIRECRYFIAVLSSASLSKTGYVQKELRMALEIRELLPDDEISLIPVRLDECSPQDDRLKGIQWADMFPSYEKGLSKVLSVLLPDKRKEPDQQEMKPKEIPLPNPVLKNTIDIFQPQKSSFFVYSGGHGFAYPVAHGNQFIGCGRLIALSEQEQRKNWEIVVPNTPNRGEINVAASELAPESFESSNLIYGQQDNPDYKFRGDCMDLAYVLAHINRSRSLKLSEENIGDIWCTGTIDIKSNKYPFLRAVNSIGFDGKLKGFVSDMNMDRLFIVPASNIENHHQAMLQEHNVNVLSLNGSNRIDIRKLCQTKTVLKVRENDLAVLRDFIFQKPSGFLSVLKKIGFASL